MNPLKFFIALLFASVVISANAAHPEPGQQVEMKLDLADGGSLSYLLYLPDNYAQVANSPVMLFLHGRGESHGPLSLV
jgi:predicted peptidase